MANEVYVVFVLLILLSICMRFKDGTYITEPAEDPNDCSKCCPNNIQYCQKRNEPTLQVECETFNMSWARGCLYRTMFLKYYSLCHHDMEIHPHLYPFVNYKLQQTDTHISEVSTFEEYVNCCPCEQISTSLSNERFSILFFLLITCLIITNRGSTMKIYDNFSKKEQNHELMKNHCKSDCDDCDAQKPWSFIFELRYVSKVTLTVFPFTLNNLAEEIVKDGKQAVELMKYEWQRYISFENFPNVSKVTPMRLAQAGFYYTGQGEEVQCFSCNARNSVWSDDDTVWNVHKHLSPMCRFIKGETTDNVPIHNQEYYAAQWRGSNQDSNHHA